MFRKKPETPHVITYDEKNAIIIEYLQTIAPAYKDQDVTAERLIEMELKLHQDRA